MSIAVSGRQRRRIRSIVVLSVPLGRGHRLRRHFETKSTLCHSSIFLSTSFIRNNRMAAVLECRGSRRGFYYDKPFRRPENVLSLSRSIFLCYSTRRLARAFLPPVVQWSLSHKACRECDSIGIKRFRRLVRIRSDTAVSSTQTLSASSHCTGEPSRSPHFWGQS